MGQHTPDSNIPTPENPGNIRASRKPGEVHFPNEQAALKVLYLVATTSQKNRANMTGRISGWKTILNALTVHYGDRITNHI
jgi:transposase-like protein